MNVTLVGVISVLVGLALLLRLRASITERDWPDAFMMVLGIIVSLAFLMGLEFSLPALMLFWPVWAIFTVLNAVIRWWWPSVILAVIAGLVLVPTLLSGGKFVGFTPGPNPATLTPNTAASTPPPATSAPSATALPTPTGTPSTATTSPSTSPTRTEMYAPGLEYEQRWNENVKKRLLDEGLDDNGDGVVTAEEAWCVMERVLRQDARFLALVATHPALSDASGMPLWSNPNDIEPLVRDTYSEEGHSWLSPRGVALYQQVVARLKAAQVIEITKAPLDQCNTGAIAKGHYVVSKACGLKGNLTALHFHWNDGKDLYVLVRCGNVVFPKTHTTGLKQGCTDTDPCS